MKYFPQVSRKLYRYFESKVEIPEIGAQYHACRYTKMTSNEDKQKRIIDRFKRHVATAGSGIFTRSAREKLLGKKRIWGGKGDEATKNTFWYRTRNQIRTASTDLQFFIESADKNACMCEPLEDSKCEKCGKVIAEPKELIR